MTSQSEGQMERNYRSKDSRKRQGGLKEDIIVKQISKVLKDFCGNHRNLPAQTFSSNMLVKIIERKPLYVADEDCCIQAVFFHELKTQLVFNPFNQLNTQYYGGHAKPHIVFNCHDEVVNEEEAPMHPSAYHPAFHYKNYQQFKERRKALRLSQSCQRIQIKSWTIAIVNISRKGYYAPLLIIKEFRRIPGVAQLHKPVQNILFSNEISVFLDNYRVEDIKRITFQVEKNTFKFPYYMRSQMKGKKASLISRFVTLDTKNELMACQQDLPINYLPFGSITQSEMFKRPVHPKYLSKRNEINLYKFDAENGAQMRQYDDDQSSSFIQRSEIDEDDYRGPQFSGEMRDEGEEIEIENDYEVDQEDHLKKVYQKAMQRQHFI